MEVNLESLYPYEDTIPAPWGSRDEIEQRRYLLNGELHRWYGPLQEVISPVCIRASGALRPKVIGRYPLLTQTESERALEMALAAYDQGRGHWPTLSVEERIHHIQDFVFRMKNTREEVVRLLMWESPSPDSSALPGQR